MISSVEVKAGGKTHRLKLSTSAMVRLERKFDQRMADILTGLDGEGKGVDFLAGFAIELVNDGAGLADADEQAIWDHLDELGGLFALMPKISEAVQLAFPAEDGEGDTQPEKAGNGRKKTTRK